MIMLTIDQLKAMPSSNIIAQGTIENSKEGIWMTDVHPGRQLLWVAKRGDGYPDWAIYTWWANEADVEFVIKQGQKVTSEDNIRKLVPCTDKAYKMYRK